MTEQFKWISQHCNESLLILETSDLQTFYHLIHTIKCISLSECQYKLSDGIVSNNLKWCKTIVYKRYSMIRQSFIIFYKFEYHFLLLWFLIFKKPLFLILSVSNTWFINTSDMASHFNVLKDYMWLQNDIS